MLVYRDQKRDLHVRQALACLGRLESLTTAARVVKLLVEFGELESGVADALEPEREANGPVLQELRRTSALIGKRFLSSWRRSKTLPGDELERAAARLGALPLPATVQIGVSEGYAYYALYPETYAEAAMRFSKEVHPDQVVVIGIRNIGASLSAVVAAAVAETARRVDSYTVRPHGHPFDRHLVLAPELEHAWRERAGAHFLIVDEGPGMSGSSLTSVAEKLIELGIPDERIVFFPSWAPDGEGFVSERARVRWKRHKKYVVPLHDIAWERGPLAVWPRHELIDISGGKWRALAYTNPADYPAVQVQHERVKFLAPSRRGIAARGQVIARSVVRDEAIFRDAIKPPCIGEDQRSHRDCFAQTARNDYISHGTSSGPGSRESKTLIKFAGLGRYGEANWERAGILADAGFAPRPLKLENGFLESEFVEGHPLAARDVDEAFLDRAANYLAFVNRRFSSTRGESFDSLMQMVYVNTQEGLGDEWALKLKGIERLGPPIDDAPAVALDAHMFPHEWLETPGGWIKTDGTEHHDDHFFPGLQNTAWDIAGTSIEFELGENALTYLIARYAELSGDRGLAARLPFYLIAYTAFRLGYCTFAAQTLRGTEEGCRFDRLVRRYRRRLASGIEALALCEVGAK